MTLPCLVLLLLLFSVSISAHSSTTSLGTVYYDTKSDTYSFKDSIDAAGAAYGVYLEVRPLAYEPLG